MSKFSNWSKRAVFMRLAVFLALVAGTFPVGAKASPVAAMPTISSPTASSLVPIKPTETRGPAIEAAKLGSAVTPSLPSKLPRTGDPLYIGMIWLAFGGIGTALFGFTLRRIRAAKQDS